MQGQDRGMRDDTSGKHRFAGVIPPLVTPLDLGDIDRPAMEKLVSYQVAAGVDGLFMLGTSGEGALLTSAQRAATVDAAASALAGRGLLLAGVPETSVARVVEAMVALERPEVDAFVVPLPYYGSFSDPDTQYAFFSAVADRASRPILIYNIPPAVHASIDLDVVRRLMGHPNIAGMKDSSADRNYFAGLLELTNGTDFALLQGSERLARWSLEQGAAGLVPGLGNLDPKTFCTLFAAVRDGDAETVAELEPRITALVALVADRPWLSYLKAATHLLGLCGPDPVAPTLPLHKDAWAGLRNELVECGLL